MEALITLGIVLLILLTAAVAYLFVQLRTFQKIDYSRMMQDEVQSTQLSSRLQMLDQLLSDLNEIESLRQQEHVQALAEGKQQLEELANRIERRIDNIPIHPRSRNALTDGPLEDDMARPAGVPIQAASTPAGDREAGLVQFLTTPRQRQIAELLEMGQTHEQIVQALSVSEHEIDLVASIVFNEDSA